MKHWTFTLILGAAYVSVFHLWLLLPQPLIAITCLATTVGLSLLLARHWRAGFFVNKWDAIFHAAVILDILLEGMLINYRQGFGFYWCALGLGLALVVYRLTRLRAVVSIRTSPPTTLAA